MKRNLKTFYLMMLALISWAVVSCSSGSDSDADNGQPTPPTGRESKSPVLGTWVNETSSDKFYALVFNADGTGVYVEESNNSMSYSYRPFKFTTVAYEPKSESSNSEIDKKSASSTQNEPKIGSIEIAFDDGGQLANTYIGGYTDIGKGGTGEYTVTTDGKLQLTTIAGIEKNIFTTTTRDLHAKPNIEGYWTNETVSMYSSDKIVMMQVNNNNSGSITVLNENTHPMVYSNYVYEFSSFDAFNDILLLYLTNNTTMNVRIKRTTYSTPESLELSIVTAPLYKSAKPSDINPNLLVGQWIGYTGDYSNNCVCLRIMGDNKMFACSFGSYLNNKINGTYSLNGRMLRVTETVYYGNGEPTTKNVSFYIKNLTSNTMHVYTDFDQFSYGKMSSVTMNKQNSTLESQMIGTWETITWGNPIPKSYTFTSDGRYSRVYNDNTQENGYFVMQEDKLNLIGEQLEYYYNIRIEGNQLYIGDYTYTKK